MKLPSKILLSILLL